MAEETNTTPETQGPFSYDGVGEKPGHINGHEPESYDDVVFDFELKATQESVDAFRKKREARKSFRSKLAKKFFGPRR